MYLMADEDKTPVIRKFRDEQPAILNFVYDAGEPFARHERELIFFTGIVVWQLFTNSVKPLRKVTQAKLKKVHIANRKAMNMMFDDSEADFASAVQRMMEQCTETSVLHYIINTIIDGDEYKMEMDTPDLPVDPDHLRPMVIHLKTVMDALIAARLKHKKNNPISPATIRAYWLRGLPVDAAPQMALQFTKEQPAIAAYLVLIDSVFTEQERVVVFNIGKTVWHVMNEECERPLREVTQEELDKAGRVNYENAEMIATDSPADSESAIQTFIEDGPEPEIMLFILAVVMEGVGYQEVAPIREEHRGYAAHCVKTVLDALVAVRDQR